MFDHYIGIDYSGAGRADERQPGIKVYTASCGAPPSKLDSPDGPPAKNWSRKGLANWLLETLDGGGRTIIGIDHAFSLPESALEILAVDTWERLLEHTWDCWRTHERPVREAFEACGLTEQYSRVLDEGRGLRLTEKWVGGAASPLVFTGMQNVGHSTHAGLPWLRKLRQELGDQITFWPFDSFERRGSRHVVAEVYPALFSKRYDVPTENTHERDAAAVCHWLRDHDGRASLAGYFDPPLKAEELEQAQVEGWVLGAY